MYLGMLYYKNEVTRGCSIYWLACLRYYQLLTHKIKASFILGTSWWFTFQLFKNTRIRRWLICTMLCVTWLKDDVCCCAFAFYIGCAGSETHTKMWSYFKDIMFLYTMNYLPVFQSTPASVAWLWWRGHQLHLTANANYRGTSNLWP